MTERNPTDETEELPVIEMTSEADQSFMDMNVDPGEQGPDKQQRYEERLERYREKGWDTSSLRPPEGVSKTLAKARVSGSRDYEKADESLLSAHEQSVQWKAGEAFEDIDISKAPDIWNDGVPEWLRDMIGRVVERGGVVWSGDYDRLPPSAEAVVKDVLDEQLTDSGGWTMTQLLQSLSNRYPDKSDGYLLNILRNEVSAVLNSTREEIYRERGPEVDEEYEFDWIGPTDHRTTDTCLSIEDRIEDRGGSVPMDELKLILYEEAVAHSDDEGTPERVDDWQPHYQCRRTFTRTVL